MADDWETIVCPDCKGKGKLFALVDGPSYSGAADVECSRCKGHGMVNKAMERWQRIGGTHRTWRVAQHESLRDCASRLGITVPHLCDMEQGRVDSSPLIGDTPEALRHG